MASNLFIGLVTHPASRFSDSSGPDGFVARLGAFVESSGGVATVRVNDRNDYDESLVVLDRDAVRESIDEEFRTESDWRAYLDGGAPGVRFRVTIALRHAARRLTLAPPWERTLPPEAPGVRMVRRLLNIELSHLSLLREAAGSGTEWTLLVEDDASPADLDRFAVDLEEFMARQGGAVQPLYVNLSESFGHQELGVSHLLSPVSTWGAQRGDAAAILSAERPVTNTVCAILYRTAFLADLVPALDAVPMTPVVPIDWKLNRALMDLHRAGRIGSGDCWTVSPAPLLQRSMHGQQDA